MIVHGFDMYRVFLSTPGDLAREQQASRAAISEVNEKQAMPKKILLVSVGLREESQIEGARSAVAENVRQSSFFIQVFEDDWGPKNLFRKMFHLATECRDDSALPMRHMVACLKDAKHEIDPEILAFRKELEERLDMQVLRFDTPEALQRQLVDVCGAWVQGIIEAGGGAAGTV
jgi:hypothetical protein